MYSEETYTPSAPSSMASLAIGTTTFVVTDAILLTRQSYCYTTMRVHRYMAPLQPPIW